MSQTDFHEQENKKRKTVIAALDAKLPLLMLTESEKSEVLKLEFESQMSELREKEESIKEQIKKDFIWTFVYGYPKENLEDDWVLKNFLPQRDFILQRIEKIKAYATLHDIKLT